MIVLYWHLTKHSGKKKTIINFISFWVHLKKEDYLGFLYLVFFIYILFYFILL